LLFLYVGLARGEVCKGSKVPRADLAAYDAQSVLSLDEREAKAYPGYSEPAN